MIRSPLVALAAILTLASAGGALAEPPAPSIAIAVSQADLADPAAVDALEIRIREAAETVCRRRVTGDLMRAYTLRSCIDATTAHALDQLDALLDVPAGARNQVAAREQ